MKKQYGNHQLNVCGEKLPPHFEGMERLRIIIKHLLKLEDKYSLKLKELKYFMVLKRTLTRKRNWVIVRTVGKLNLGCPSKRGYNFSDAGI